MIDPYLPIRCKHDMVRAQCALCSAPAGRELRSRRRFNRHDKRRASARTDRRKLHRPGPWTVDARADRAISIRWSPVVYTLKAIDSSGAVLPPVVIDAEQHQ